MNGGVENVEAGDRGCARETVGVEEFGLGLAAVRTFAVPPFGTFTVDLVTGGTSHYDVFSRDGNEGAGPLFISECGCALKDDLFRFFLAGGLKSSRGDTHVSSGCEAGKIQSCA